MSANAAEQNPDLAISGFALSMNQAYGYGQAVCTLGSLVLKFQDRQESRGWGPMGHIGLGQMQPSEAALHCSRKPAQASGTS